MSRISFFRVPKPRQFKYEPIFYDERKEALKLREQQIKQELGLADPNEPRVSNIKGRMREYYKHNLRHKSRGNIRFIITLIILCILMYFLLYH